MGKLGYTWYPKDWGNSDAVFELNLEERGLYRELIDMAMLNDNKTEIKLGLWSRKFDCDKSNLDSILDVLQVLKLIKIDDNFIFVPSCEPRLKLVRGGKKGGKKSTKNKPTVKPTVKPLVSLNEKNDKPTLNQRESKVNINIKERDVVEENPISKFTDWFNARRTQYLEIESNFKRLSYQDKKNLEELKELYKKEDFEKVMINMVNDKYCNEANRIIPSHFLEYFDNYISQEQKPLITKKQKVQRGWKS